MTQLREFNLKAKRTPPKPEPHKLSEQDLKDIMQILKKYEYKMVEQYYTVNWDVTA